MLGCASNVIDENKLIQKIESLDMTIFSKSGDKIYSISSPNSSYDNIELEFELKNLPSKIDNIEKEINTLSNQLSDPDFYLNDPDGFLLASENLAIARSELEKYELRWLELEELKTD